MDKLEELKDIRTIASISAVMGVVAMSVYFQNEISQIKTEVKEMQEHLATVVPYVDPKTNQNVDRLKSAIIKLDTKLSAIQSSDLGEYTARPTPKKYSRMTSAGRRKDTGHRSSSTTTTNDDEHDSDDDHRPPNNDPDYNLDDDISAMKN